MKKTIRDIDLSGKTVLVRVDYNVPIDGGIVGDTLRIASSFDTIKYLQEKNCKIILISHLGRPEGKPERKFSLEPVAKKASVMLGKTIKFVPDCIGYEVEEAVRAMKPGDIILLENLRFHEEEEDNDTQFAEKLASYAQVFVQDGFAAIHRAHASTEGVTKFLPSVSGFLVEREVNTITEALEKPERPFMAVVGGAKISDKIEVLTNLMKKVDILLVGGAMANTFLAAQGFEVGESLREDDQAETAQKIINQASEDGVNLVLPLDVVVTDKIDKDAKGRTVDTVSVKKQDIIADLGPKTIEKAMEGIEVVRTVIWNGPLGVTEVPEFSKASLDLANRLIASKAKTIIGGGDTAAFIDKAGLHDKFDWISTGGGASLELMAGKKLPGWESLLDK